MRKVIGPAALLCLILMVPARAEPVGDTLQAFEFFGRWAPDCSRPPALDNSWREVEILPSGDVRFVERLGTEYQPNVYVVMNATRTGSDSIVLRIELNDTTLQDLTMTRKDGKIRTLINVPVLTGKPVVKDGRIVANGRETPWLTQCGPEPAKVR